MLASKVCARAGNKVIVCHAKFLGLFAFPSVPFRKLLRQINVPRVLLKSLLNRFMCDEENFPCWVFLNSVCFYVAFGSHKIRFTRHFPIYKQGECLQRDHRRLDENNLTTLHGWRTRFHISTSLCFFSLPLYSSELLIRLTQPKKSFSFSFSD